MIVTNLRGMISCSPGLTYVYIVSVQKLTADTEDNLFRNLDELFRQNSLLLS